MRDINFDSTIYEVLAPYLVMREATTVGTNYYHKNPGNYKGIGSISFSLFWEMGRLQCTVIPASIGTTHNAIYYSTVWSHIIDLEFKLGWINFIYAMI